MSNIEEIPLHSKMSGTPNGIHRRVQELQEFRSYRSQGRQKADEMAAPPEL
jgi:hypothetical protein